MLHITDGESVAGTLRESAIPGKVSTYGDLMCEGPAPANLDAKAWIDVRARFMAEVGYASVEEARDYLQGFEDTLASFSQHEEVVIWLDHRLTNQLILIKVLDWFSHRNLGGTKLSLICVGPHAGMENFVGLGAMTADQLASLADTRQPVTEAQYRTAVAAWKAFTSPDPREIERVIDGDTSALPYLGSTLRRHLEQFPSVDGGLSRTQRHVLSILRAQGPLSSIELWVAAQSLEEAVFMGDSPFFRLAADLSRASHPLVQISDPEQPSLGVVTITETGRKVVEGQADHVQLNGIDQWLGGVHLQGTTAAWRWNRTTRRIVNQIGLS
jgi:hypothetical protein